MSKLRGELIDELLTQYGPPNGWQARVTVRPCEGTKFHSPTPLTTSLFDECSAWLCPTCTSKLEIFLHLHEQDPACLTWDVMREFGNQIRLFGQGIVAERAAKAS
jgi:hypothetical protein